MLIPVSIEQHNCALCAYCIRVRPDPTVLQDELRCIHSPPTAVGVAVPSGPGRINVQLSAHFPPVHARMVCGQYVARPTESPQGNPEVTRNGSDAN